MEINAFSYIGYSIENATRIFLVEGTGNLISGIAPLVLIAVTINFMIKGYLMMEGKIDAPAIDVVHQALLIYLIVGLVMSASTYTAYVVEFVKSLASGLSGSILPDQSSGSDVFEALDKLINTGIEQISYCWQKVGMNPKTLMWGLVCLIIGGSLLTVTIIAATIIIGSKFLLTILLMIGPLFFILFCFPSTKRFFESWVAKVVENILVQVFGVTVVFLALKMIEGFIGRNDITTDDINPFGVSIQILIISGILTYVIRQIPNLAGSLAGGFASQSLRVRDLLPNKPNLPTRKPKDTNPSGGNSISDAGAVDRPRNELSQDLKDRMFEHSQRN